LQGAAIGLRVANFATGGAIPTFGIENLGIPDIPVDISVPVPDVLSAGASVLSQIQMQDQLSQMQMQDQLTQMQDQLSQMQNAAGQPVQ
jgi:hypothetical protein